MFNIKWRNAGFILSAVVLVATTSCSSDTSSDDENELVVTTEIKKKVASAQFNIDGEIFSIPSPIQTAVLIKGSGADFFSDILSSPKSTPNYTTKFQRALNLGVYGADLGYVTLYDDPNEQAISYLTSVQKLSDILNLSGAFDAQLIQRFSENIGNQDSMLVIVSDAYRAGDDYLKANDRSEVAALILAGGWLESLYFATEVAKTHANQNVIDRIGEQKSSLYSLISLLSKHADDEEYKNLVKELILLHDIFEEVQFNFEYIEATTDRSTQTTTINSKTTVNISKENLEAITEKVNSIRNQIIG